MIARIISIFVFLAVVPIWSQVEPGASGGAPVSGSDTEMTTPPPVSGMAYPTTFASEIRSNYLLAGISVNGAYVSNVLPGSGVTPVNDATFTILPTLALSRSTPRQIENLSYSPSFLIYEPDSTLDSINQGAALNFMYRFSQQVSLSVSDSFYRTSDVFDQSYTFSNGGITGSIQSPGATAIVPFAEQLTNFVNGTLSYQFGRDGMVGAGGFYSTFELPNSSNAFGLSSSNGGGVSAFYNRRLSRAQYFGMEYEYSQISTTGLNEESTTTVNSLLPFYTVYFTKTISFSASAGIEHDYSTLPQSPPLSSWSPAATLSAGWQGNRANFVASYTHAVTAGNGLFGAFHSNGANAFGGWRLTRNWNARLSASYLNLSTLTPQTSNYAGGTTITGQASLTRRIGENFTAEFGYERLHEEYSTISVNPDSNEAYARITYQFRRPVGR
jgi:hypothetical protein